MARARRLYAPGGTGHVVPRCNNREFYQRRRCMPPLRWDEGNIGERRSPGRGQATVQDATVSLTGGFCLNIEKTAASPITGG